MIHPNQSVVINVKHVYKSFILPHARENTLRGLFVHLFEKKQYEVFPALQDVTFSVRAGEFIGIIGKNGSGKSTLLKMMAGIYPPDRGAISMTAPISPFLELGIGFHPELSGRDNIYLNGAILGLTRRQIDERLIDIIAFSGLERFLDQKLKNYSSGMHVRLAFSVAIHANKDIYLMDEVLAVGDAEFQKKCIDFFLQQKQAGKTIVLVTHSLADVERYCDRALLLDQGRILSHATPKETIHLYQQLLTS